MRYQAFIFVAATILFIVSCDLLGSGDRKAPEYFTAEYRFVNTTDSLILTELITATYFPDKDITTIHFEVYEDVFPGDTLLYRADSVKIGSTLQIGAKILTQWGDGRYYRTFILNQDSVQTPGDLNVTFTWPDDTLQSSESSGNLSRDRLRKIMPSPESY